MTEGIFIDSDDDQKNDREYEGSTHPSDRKSFVKYAVVSSNIQSVNLEEVREFRTLPLNEKVRMSVNLLNFLLLHVCGIKDICSLYQYFIF